VRSETEKNEKEGELLFSECKCESNVICEKSVDWVEIAVGHMTRFTAPSQRTI